MKIFLSNKSKQKINFQHTVLKSSLNQRNTAETDRSVLFSNYFKIKLKTVDFNVL